LERDSQRGVSDVFTYGFMLVWTVIAIMIFFPLAIFGIYFILSYEKRKNEIKYKAREARLDLKSFHSNSYLPDQERFKWEDQTKDISSVPIYCFQCGSKLELEDKYCPTCGDSTKEEFQTIEK